MINGEFATGCDVRSKSIESMLREIHTCRDCLRTFIIEKPPLRKTPPN